MKSRLLPLMISILLMVGVFTTSVLSADAPRMTKEELKALLGQPDLIIIDVRTGSDWTASDLKIMGSIREDPYAIAPWTNKYPKDKTLVLY
jgi:hypothetical protein